MVLRIETLKDQATAGLWTSAERLWLTADRTRVVPDGHPEARFQLVAPGHSIPMTQARELGLVKPTSAVPQGEPEPAPPAEETPEPEAPKAEEPPTQVIPPETKRQSRKTATKGKKKGARKKAAKRAGSG